MELNFNEVRTKDFINIYDGKILGRAVDIVFDQITSTVKGFSLPMIRKTFSFKKPENIFVSVRQIVKIGEDVILVELKPKVANENQNFVLPKTFKVVRRTAKRE